MDLIKKAINKGFHSENEKYYLWEIQKWLREVHNIHLWNSQIPKIPFDIIKEKGNVKNLKEFKVALFSNEWNPTVPFDVYGDTYEEALEEGLYRALLLIKKDERTI